MTTLWYLILGGMLIAFAVFDGLNLGTGAMHLLLGKNNNERRVQLGAVGPVWFGYEVWLLAAGGSMVSAFPTLYAKSFSGFYIVLNLVLWLLIIRGTSIEFRHQVDNDLWRGFWDVWYCISSALLAILFGAAVGNVIRGVPFDEHLNFTGSLGLALNPYAILVGVLSLVYLAMHGSLFVAVKSGIDEHRERAHKVGGWLYAAAVVLMLLTTAVSPLARPGLLDNFHRFPALVILPLLTIAGAVGIGVSLKAGNDNRALVSSAITLAALMGSAGASLWPNLLPNLGQASNGLTIYNTAAPQADLTIAAILNLIGVVAVVLYGIYVHKVFKGRVDLAQTGHAY
ncbi:MAG: cytochrome d ubiquinol oxidase subunit II [Capsulimonadaceae bacterium]|nr:cytochrome d ubiquinol oxidase subunit II [Capsulimonadaceae bacterium]